MFQYIQPTQIIAGEDSLSELPGLLTMFQSKSILIVSEKGVVACGHVDLVKQVIKDCNVTLQVFDNVLPDPPIAIINEAIEKFKDSGIDTIIAVGGGSSIDAAKAISIGLSFPGNVSDYFFHKTGAPIMQPGKVLISLPTTSGTGSEVSSAAVITDTDGSKRILAGLPCYSNVAIIDCKLSLTLPKSMTIATAMDAFSHCAEAYTTVAENPLSDAFCEKGMRLILENLPLAVADGKNEDARYKLGLAATLGGLALNCSSAHLGHSFAHIMGGNWHITHGFLCANALPFVLEYVSEAKPAKIKGLCTVMGIESDKLSDVEAMAALKDAIIAFSDKMGVPKLSSYSQVTKDQFSALAEQTIVESMTFYSPKQLTAEAAVKIYDKMYSL